MSSLERRYARLVRLYPSGAPREEILATVLQRSGEFSFREAFALIAGALRARTGANTCRTPAEFAHSAARLAALALLVDAAVVDAHTTSAAVGISAVLRSPAGIDRYAVVGLVALLLHTAAVAALARGAYRLAAAGAVLGLAAVILLVGAGRAVGPGWPVGEGDVLLALAVGAVALSFLDPRIPLAVAALGLSAALSDLIPLRGSPDLSLIASHVVNSSLPLLLIATAALGRRSSTRI